jgi:glycosyltransferase involved in cell wall biosynthesis
MIAVFHAPWSYALFAPVALRMGVPRVLWQHDSASGRPMIERWARRTPADLVVCNSAWTSSTAGALQPDVPTAVVHPPVTLIASANTSSKELRASLDTASSDVVLLSASRLERWKGHLHLVRALARLRQTGGWVLWIAGGAQRPHEVRYTTELRAEVARLGLASRVRFLGERRDVPALMKAADLFCQANEGPEPFGVVFAEALLSGVPVVTADLGGAPEIVGCGCGRLVPAHDIDALARALDTLIADAALRARLGSNGPAHARARVAPDVVLPQLARTLRGILATAVA